MLCRNCPRYDSIPGMKWGVCDRKRESIESTRSSSPMITGPDRLCMYQRSKTEEEDDE